MPVLQDGDGHVLLVTLHHTITDGWSTGIICRELSAAYNAFAPIPTPACPPAHPVRGLLHLAAQLAQGRDHGPAAAVLGAQDAGGRPPLGLPLRLPAPQCPHHPRRPCTSRLDGHYQPIHAMLQQCKSCDSACHIVSSSGLFTSANALPLPSPLCVMLEEKGQSQGPFRQHNRQIDLEYSIMSSEVNSK